MSTPKYYMHPNAKYRNNPFIEGLGLPLTLKEFESHGAQPFECDLNLEGIDPELHGYYIRTIIDGLAEVYTVQDEAFRLYDLIRRMIEAGYSKRNPLHEDIRRILMAIERDKDEPWKATNIKSLDLFDSQQSYVLLGLSGRGKTTMIKQICKQIAPVIEHSDYTNQHGDLFQVNKTQITYLYFEVHDRRGQKAFLLSLLESIDDATGENYKYISRNKSVSELITTVRKAVIGHAVGMIIIDEAQNLSKSSKSETINNNEKTSMKFIEELFNRLGVPLLFVGTFATFPLFSREGTIGRRATKNGSLMLASCDVESSFWKRLNRLLCQTDLLKNQSTKPSILRRHIHYLSVGIPAIATSLVRATLSYLTFLKPEDQDLSIAALDHIFNREFKVLHPALTALRSGKYDDYEDFAPMRLLEEIEEQVDPQEAIEQKVEAIEQKIMQGEVRVSKQAKKPCNDKALKASKQIEPESIMHNLGYGTKRVSGE